jgi:hypothetical protein
MVAGSNECRSSRRTADIGKQKGDWVGVGVGVTGGSDGGDRRQCVGQVCRPSVCPSPFKSKISCAGTRSSVRRGPGGATHDIKAAHKHHRAGPLGRGQLPAQLCSPSMRQGCDLQCRHTPARFSFTQNRIHSDSRAPGRLRPDQDHVWDSSGPSGHAAGLGPKRTVGRGGSLGAGGGAMGRGVGRNGCACWGREAKIVRRKACACPRTTSFPPMAGVGVEGSAEGRLTQATARPAFNSPAPSSRLDHRMLSRIQIMVLSVSVQKRD